MSKIRVAVLRGGPSDEYDLSMQTGKAVIDALDPEQFEVLDVVVTKNGEWLYAGKARFPEQILASVDVAFVALHGAFGADGKVQRLLDRMGIPYTGSKSYASGVAVNKVLTKDFLRDKGIKMPPHMVVSQDSLRNIHGLSENIASMFGPEYVIKPVDSGSSLGAMMVQNTALLPQALTDALNTYPQVLVEKRIPGKEATCGVVNRFREKNAYVLPAIEVQPGASGIYDADAKQDCVSHEMVPGNFSSKQKQELEKLTKDIHEYMGLSQYSRSDFVVGDDGEIYFLEVNTHPQLTPQTSLARGVESVGSSFKELIEHLVRDALRKQ
ncbi:ATP-grasp domain-containing protein [Candidatus Kaiserbacteria bacterium]|nr:ATP-grasp domain-containing protein [Candidatus Kaiserbacteria bacterium]